MTTTRVVDVLYSYRCNRPGPGRTYVDGVYEGCTLLAESPDRLVVVFPGEAVPAELVSIDAPGEYLYEVAEPGVDNPNVVRIEDLDLIPMELLRLDPDLSEWPSGPDDAA